MKRLLFAQANRLLVGLKHQMKYKKYLVISIVMTMFITMLFSCRNDLKTIEALSTHDTLPELIVKDVIMYRSDSGFKKAKLISRVVQHFGGDNPYMLFPEGLHIIFYDRQMNEESTLTAGYGKSYTKRKLFVAQKNVIVRNLIKKEQLNTEELNWDERKKTIYSNVKVKITTPTDVLYGTALQSDERFDRYVITDPTGEVEVQDEKIEK